MAAYEETGDAARGIAPPSTQLAARDVDFRFGSSSGPADYWGIPPETLYQLTARYRELAEREIHLAGQILGLSGSAPHSRVRVAASFEEGGVVIWKDTERTRQFGHGLNMPRTTFTVTGKLIAVDESRIEVYGTAHSNLSIESTIASPGEPLSVIPASRDSFAVLCSDGRLTMYQVLDS